MSDVTNGFESSETLPLPSDTSSISSELPSLGELLREHLEKCSLCQRAIQTTPNGLGMVSRLCFEYQDIIAAWADREGSVNNIVAHDEYGNYASDTPHERYPDQWR